MFSLQRLLMILTGVVLLTGLSSLASEHVRAGTYSYHNIRLPVSYRSSAHYYNRRRFARYNRFYRYRLRNYGRYYNHHPDYGNSYLGDAYNKADDNDVEATEHDAGLRSDAIDKADPNNVPGWLQLANREYLDALNTFSTQARIEPNDGTLMIGYALAAAETGDLHKGVWAMRSALRIDPESLINLTLDASLEGIVKNLITQYSDDRQDTLAIVAKEFMIASLYYLLGDNDSAGKSLPVEDTDSSTKNLSRLIEHLQQDR
jgi:hypothetical protein